LAKTSKEIDLSYKFPITQTGSYFSSDETEKKLRTMGKTQSTFHHKESKKTILKLQIFYVCRSSCYEVVHREKEFITHKSAEKKSSMHPRQQQLTRDHHK
jgi:hypothetical protein